MENMAANENKNGNGNGNGNFITVENQTLDLKVDTTPLNETLASINASLRRHANLIDKIPALQNDQRVIRRDLNIIRLNLSSQERILELGLTTSASASASGATSGESVRSSTRGRDTLAVATNSGEADGDGDAKNVIGREELYYTYYDQPPPTDGSVTFRGAADDHGVERQHQEHCREESKSNLEETSSERTTSGPAGVGAADQRFSECKVMERTEDDEGRSDNKKVQASQRATTTVVTYRDSVLAGAGAGEDVDYRRSQSTSTSTRHTTSNIQHRPVNRAVRRFAIEMDHSSLQALRKEVFGMKALLAHLQEEHNFEIAHTTDIDGRLHELETSISNILDGDGSGAGSGDKHGSGRSRPGPLASTAALNHLKQFMLKKFDDLLQAMEETEHSIKDDVDCHLGEKLSEIKKNFHNLKDLVRSRQVQMNDKMSTFAKHTDLAVFEESVENNLNDHTKRMDMLEDSILSNEDALLRMKQRYSFMSFVNIHVRWKRKALGAAWSKWQVVHRTLTKDEELTQHTRKVMRKVLIRCWYGKKAAAWEKWQDLVKYQRLFEAKRDQAKKVVQRWMETVITQPTRRSFDKWRRAIISSIMEESSSKLLERRMTDITAWKENMVEMEQVMCERTEEKMDEFERTSNQVNVAEERRRSSLPHMFACDLPPVDTKSGQYDLWNLLSYLKSDQDGALQTLAQAIINVRDIDIGNAREDMQLGLETMSIQFRDALSMEVQRLAMNSAQIENHSNEQFDSLSTELPPIKSSIAEMRNSLHGTINKVKVIEKSHRDRIELLCEGKEVIEEDVTELKTGLLQAQKKIKHLEEGLKNSQINFTMLLHRMNEFEILQRENQELLTSEISNLNYKLTDVKRELQENNQIRDKLQDELCATRNNLIQAKITSESKFDEVNGILDAHGIQPPKWDKLVEYGILYEKIAKEKTYVVPLNCVSDGKKEIDVPGFIASFAFDYAAWVAFEADHEALKIVVTGKNPDDVVYAEDETENRRNALVDRFRVKISGALDEAFPDAGAIRLEARNRYLGRLIDAINSALSKHDKVSIPASTRLGRVRSAATNVCMACDRPLTSKGMKRQTTDIDKSESTRTPLEVVNAIHPKAFNSNEEKGFVMRAGFKMPVG